MTTYIILFQDSSDKTAWIQESTVNAASADAAIRANAKDQPEGTCVYVAVPARSFVPVTVTVETKPVQTLSRPEAQKRPPAEKKTETPAE